jgi:hypothetical protein
MLQKWGGAYTAADTAVHALTRITAHDVNKAALFIEHLIAALCVMPSQQPHLD